MRRHQIIIAEAVELCCVRCSKDQRCKCRGGMKDGLKSTKLVAGISPAGPVDTLACHTAAGPCPRCLWWIANADIRALTPLRWSPSLAASRQTCTTETSGALWVSSAALAGRCAMLAPCCAVKVLAQTTSLQGLHALESPHLLSLRSTSHYALIMSCCGPAALLPACFH